MLLQFLKKILDYISKLINAFIHRFEKNNQNPYGYAMGGPKSMRLKVGLVLGLVAAFALVTILTKGGYLLSVDNFLDRETAPGPKLPTDISNSFDKLSVSKLEMRTQEIDGRVDCDRLLSNLKIRGTLTEREKIDFDRVCREKFGQSLSDIIDKIIAGEIPASAASNIIQAATTKDADSVARSLNNQAVLDGLRGDSADAIAKGLADLGNMSDDEITKAVASVRMAPPQYKEDVMLAVQSAAKIKEPEARTSLLNAIDKARSKEELSDIKDFGDTLLKAKPEEQVTFAKAYEKAPDLQTKRALKQTVKEIIQIPEDDPVRGKLTDLVEKTSELAPEEQKQAYKKIGDVASEYRLTEDPDKKRALGESILSSESVQDLASLGERLRDIREAKKVMPLDKDTEMSVLTGYDPENIKKVAVAAELQRSGDTESAKKALKNELSDDEITIVMERARERSKDPFKPMSNHNEGSDVTSSDLKKMIGDQTKFEEKKQGLEAKIKSHLTQGVSPTSPELIDAYKELSTVNDKLNDLNTRINEGRMKLKARLNDLKKRTIEEYAAAGIAVPEFEVKLPDDIVNKGAPSERLSNLRDVEEFWTAASANVKQKNQFFKFDVGNRTSNGNASTGSSILSKLTKNVGTWYVGVPGGGSQGANNVVREFEMSHMTYIPGILKRIPQGGIHSKAAAQTTILFEFLGVGVNRKTGLVEIPIGSHAICKVKDFDNESGRLNANCNAVDVGGRTNLRVNFVLGDANGSDGVLAEVIDHRGFKLGGIFLTAFAASILDGYSQTVISPFEQRATKSAADFVAIGSGTGAGAILQEVAQKQIQDWTNASTIWAGHDGMLAIIKQQ